MDTMDGVIEEAMKSVGLEATVAGALEALVEWSAGERDPARIAGRSATAAGVTTARGAVRRGVEHGLREGARRFGQETLKAAARTNAVGAIACFTADAVIDGARLAAGRIDGREFGRRTARSAGRAAGGAGGAAAGAALGTLIAPGVGTAVGGFLGGLIGAVGGQRAVGSAQGEWAGDARL